jgi:hypothetical protein
MRFPVGTALPYLAGRRGRNRSVLAQANDQVGGVQECVRLVKQLLDIKHDLDAPLQLAGLRAGL